ncbi:SAGA complex subunit Sgf73 [Mycoemilia scoparia]|uniref:SAGA complex subunit Sgf73 n=1 Tax=Mycoemilia scoparia TaxID=417184 RepID=A0A9W7ZZR2_9FUNG|nr:SAGA complex subunit Sgf73 [Mycoemilia scoparia]
MGNDSKLFQKYIAANRGSAKDNFNDNGSTGSSTPSTIGSAMYNGVLDEAFTPEQRQKLMARLDMICRLEEEIESIRRGSSSPLSRNKSSGGSDKDRVIKGSSSGLSTPRACTVFKVPGDWKLIPESMSELPTPVNLTWEQIKKSVAEEDKYQSKKNWSSTKGKGNRKPPVARRLDLDSLKAFGVMPLEQYPYIAFCDSCNKPVNALNLKDHQDVQCMVSEVKSDKKASGGRSGGTTSASRKRQASEAIDSDDTTSRASVKEVGRSQSEKKARIRKERKEKKEKERREKKEAKSSGGSGAGSNAKDKQKMPVDLDSQCGVLISPSNQPCGRSLTCKTHSMAAKRAVRGRSQLFDALLQAHLAKSRSMAAQKNMANKSARAAAVRNATALALGGNGVLPDSLLDQSDSDEDDSDLETEKLIKASKQSRPTPMATRPYFIPRCRHRYLRVRDLFADALKPSPVSLFGPGGGNGSVPHSATIPGSQSISSAPQSAISQSLSNVPTS